MPDNTTSKPGPIPYLDIVNQALSQAIPTVGLVVGAVELVRELFKRKESGQPEMTLAEMAEFIVKTGENVSKTSQNWLQEHGYDAEGKKKVPDVENPGT